MNLPILAIPISLISGFVYKSILKCNRNTFVGRLAWTILSAIRSIIVKIADPPCIMTVHGIRLSMPLSHTLPLFVRVNPLYDTLITRVADHIRKHDKRLVLIDVGANIGDTIAFAKPTSGDKVLAIEASSKYLEHLQINMRNFSNVCILNQTCSDTATKSTLGLSHTGGTARLIQQTEVHTVTNTIDIIVEERPEFKEVNFIKIDTDGHDFAVIRGAAQILSRVKPALLFECDDFKQPNFIQELNNVFTLLGSMGYKNAIIYDNNGNIHSVVDITNSATYKYNLLHKMITGLYYFDILLLKQNMIEEFLRTELAFFISRIGDPVMREQLKYLLNS